MTSSLVRTCSKHNVVSLSFLSVREFPVLKFTGNCSIQGECYVMIQGLLIVCMFLGRLEVFF